MTRADREQENDTEKTVRTTVEYTVFATAFKKHITREEGSTRGMQTVTSLLNTLSSVSIKL